MSGLYPDYPNNRIAYELINAKWYDASGPVELDISMSANTNSENFAANFIRVNGDYVRFLLLPFQMDITHIHLSGSRCSATQWSSDTTNGVDGTWSGLSVPTYGASAASARQNITPISLPACRAIYFLIDGTALTYAYIQALHLYGKPTSGQNPDRVEFWHPTLDQRVPPAHFDWGDAPRGASADKTFRVKNLSDVLTSNNIVVSTSSLSDASPSFSGSHLFSTGGSFTATVDIPSLAPGAISSTITVRKATPSNAQLSLWTSRVIATPGSWS